MLDHGVRSAAELSAAGLGRAEIERLVAVGDLERIRRGWYALPFANEQVVRALRAGGRLGCLSGCRFHGLWVPQHHELHVAYGAGSRPGPVPGVDLHPGGRAYPEHAVWPLLDCLAQAARRHSAETALIVLESARNLGFISESETYDVLAELPRRRSRVVRFMGPAESGSETRVRLFLQQLNIPVAAQAVIDGVGRVDLLVGNNLIIECDSDEHHRSKEAHHKDRTRDLAARDLGYQTIRLSYRQIWFDWDATRESLLTTIRTRRHLRGPRSRA